MKPFQLLDLIQVFIWSAAISSAVDYLLLAWNESTGPVHLCKLLFRKKFPDVEHVFTRDELCYWMCAHFPEALASLLNCPICQRIYLVAVLSVICGVMHAATAGVAFISGVIALSFRWSITRKPTAAEPLLGVSAGDGKTSRESAYEISQPVSPVNIPNVPAPISPAVGADYAAFSSIYGIRLVDGEGGAKVIDPASLTPEFKRNLVFFDQGFLAPRDCWFEGCLDMHTAYLKETAALEADKEGNCPEPQKCQKGAVVRKYMTLIHRYSGNNGVAVN